MMNDSLTATYVGDLIGAKTPDALTFSTIRALEVIGANCDWLPSSRFAIWALASAAKARRLELSELYPDTTGTRTMVAMGGYTPVVPSYQLAQYADVQATSLAARLRAAEREDARWHL